MQRWDVSDPQNEPEKGCPGLIRFIKSDKNQLGGDCNGKSRKLNCGELWLYPNLLSKETRVHYMANLDTSFVDGEWVINDFNNKKLKSLPGIVQVSACGIGYTCKKNESYHENITTFFELISILDPSLNQIKSTFFESINLIKLDTIDRSEEVKIFRSQLFPKSKLHTLSQLDASINSGVELTELQKSITKGFL